jgi:putative tricarboxylic transport membrane protein
LVTTAAGNAARHMTAGKMRILGIAADKRMPGAMASVPTWKEQGVNIVFGGWRSIMGPKGMTPAQITYWENTLKQVVESPEWKADLERNFWADDFSGSAKFGEELDKDYAAMRSVLTELGLAK